MKTRAISLVAILARRSLIISSTALALLFVVAGPAQGALVSRNILKSFFQKGDKPTASQFGTLIDSMVNYTEDRYLLGLKSYDPALFESGAALLDAGTVIDSSMVFGPAAGLTDAWAGHTGFLALAFTEGSDPAPHYGYLQITASGPSDPYPMSVEYFVYEDRANTPVTITSVPEPSAFALGAMAGLLGVGFCVARKRQLATV